MGNMDTSDLPKKLRFKDRICSHLRNNWKGDLLWLFTTILLSLLWDKATPMIKVIGVIIITLIAIILVFFSERAHKIVSGIIKNISIQHTNRIIVTFMIILCIVSIILEGFVFRSNIYSLFDSSSSNINDLYLNNQYVKYTTNPDLDRHNKYALLLEFGVRRSQANVDVLVNTGEKYISVNGYIGSPSMTDGSQNPIDQGKGEYYVGYGSQITSEDKTNPPIYKVTLNSLVYTDNSYYIYFESDKPLSPQTVVFNGQSFINQSGVLIPK